MMKEKVYMILGLETAMHVLRPGAKWEITNSQITRWDDPRPCPTWEEVMDTMDKIKKFEDSINTIWLPEQTKERQAQEKQIEDALAST
jgi:hypothetical protein